MTTTCPPQERATDYRPLARYAASAMAVLLATVLPLAVLGAMAPPDDPWQRGQLIASGGGPGGVAAACFTCHGRNGEGQAASGFPRLAGLDSRYQAKQLADYASGARPHEIMGPLAEALTDDDRRAVAVYFAHASGRQAGPVEWQGAPALVQEGSVLYALGSAASGLQACAACHGPSARGLPPSFPALAGQNAAYTEEQLHRFRSGVRRNDFAAVMRTIAARLSDRQIAAMAAYLAELAPGNEPAATDATAAAP